MAEVKMNAAERRSALELEFERLKERADFLDKILQGNPDVWVKISVALREHEHIGVIEMDKPVTEARQTALAMATVYKSLHPPGKVAPAPVEEPVDPLAVMEKERDELAARRAAKPA